MKATTGVSMNIPTHKDTIPSVAVLLTIAVCMVCAAFVVDAEATPAAASAAPAQVADAD
jgi:hypothetical protein